MNKLNKIIIKNIKLFHVFRIVFACVIAFITSSTLNIPYGVWTSITIIVLMSANYSGAVYKKANQRILGTIVGAIFGLSLYLFPDNAVVLHYVLLVVMLCVSTYFTIGKYSYSGVLASITLVLVAGSGPGDLDVALWRTTNVLWGAALSILVSRYFFPAKATYHFKMLCADFLSQFHQLYSQHNIQVKDQDEYQLINTSSLSLILKQASGLEASVNHETPAIKDAVKKILACQVRMFSLLENITQTPWRHQYGHKKIIELKELFESKEQTSFIIGSLSEHLSANRYQSFTVNKSILPILSLYPEMLPNNDVKTDISYYGYLWLNRELARKVISLSDELSKTNIIKQNK